MENIDYREAIESINLQYLNNLLIKKENSIEYQSGLKKVLVKNALKTRDFKFFLNHMKAKLFRTSYYCSDGNRKYKYIDLNNLSYITLPKVAVYSCIVGAYDEILEPLYLNDNIDYFLFTDQVIKSNSIWKKIDITQFEEYNSTNATALNRKIKILPFNYLKNYDYSIYIDGNIQVVADLMPLVLGMKNAALAVHTHAIRDCVYKEANGIDLLKKADPQKVYEQLMRYKEEGFPEHYGLFQNSILIRNHKNENCIKLMSLWWEEYSKQFTRDQLSLPYVIWKMKLNLNEVVSLGNDVYQNPRFRITTHQ